MRLAWWIRGPVVTGAAACGTAAAACAWSIAAALRVEPAPTVEMLPSTVPAAAIGGAAGAQLQEPDLRRALDSDPFRADRRRPPRRFVLPGAAAPLPRVAAPTVSLTLTGTVTYPDGGGFALVRAPGQAPVMVRVGESVEGHTLRSVARDEATFVRPGGGSVVLRVPKAGG